MTLGLLLFMTSSEALNGFCHEQILQVATITSTLKGDSIQ